MRISTTTSVSVVALAAVAALGVQYAGAAPTSVAPHSNAATSAGSTVTTKGTLLPQGKARANIAYLYSSQDSSGSGQLEYTIPNPPSGYYHASFTANFFPDGTPSAPVTFSCYLEKNFEMRAQSTVSTTYDDGFYAGVNGSNSVKVNPGDTFTAGCGTADGSTWAFGSRPLQVSFTRIDGLTNIPLNKAAKKAAPGAAGTR